MLNTLSGRFLILTTVFVMLAEVMIFVPSIARFREDYLRERLERAQIASLALLADDMLEMELEAELLENAEVFNVVLRRDEVRQLMLASPIPQPISETFDLRDPGPMVLIRDALSRLVTPENELIRVIGAPVRDAGLLIEITMDTRALRMSMVDYGIRILILSAVISIFTAVLLFMAVRMFLVRPIKGVVRDMQSYASNPEDARRIISPKSTLRELREAEFESRHLELEVTESVAIRDLKRAREALDPLREQGVRVALDDFGTGYSSLASLGSLPIDTVKLDRSFLPRDEHDADAVAISEAVLVLAHRLRFGTVAEGIETEWQAEFVRSRGCQVMQGFLYGAPTPVAQYEELLVQSAGGAVAGKAGKTTILSR